MPSHNHQQSVTAATGGTIKGRADWVSDGDNLNQYPQNSTTYSTGGGQAHNNMPPYLAVYMWKRTA
jgi:microcystin-dependent protein